MTFEPGKVMKTVALFRARPKDEAKWLRFGRDPLEVYVRRTLENDLIRLLRSQDPRETIGLLAGRVCRDGKGIYTIVDAVEVATEHEIESTTGSVHISGSGHATLRKRLEREHPTLDIVGWWHTHPHYSAVFSAEDKREQSTWTGEGSVGIVVSGLSNGEILGVYGGSGAIRLTPRKVDGFFQPAFRSLENPSLEILPIKVRPTSQGSPSRRERTPWLVRRSWIVVAIGLVVANMLTGAMYVRLNNRLSALEIKPELERRAVSEQMEDQRPSSSETSIASPMTSPEANSMNAGQEPVSITPSSSVIRKTAVKPTTTPRSRPQIKKAEPAKKQNQGTNTSTARPTEKNPPD